ncbi:MAG: hypothetical protein M3121_02300 [Chloroflexota bacterium]|nr:hypothetical protein [Chloroflexota bacterium]
MAGRQLGRPFLCPLEIAMMLLLAPDVSDGRDPEVRHGEGDRVARCRFSRADPDGFFTDGQSPRPDPLGLLLVSLAPIDRIRAFVTRIPPIGPSPRRPSAADPTAMPADGRTARAEAANS